MDYYPQFCLEFGRKVSQKPVGLIVIFFSPLEFSTYREFSLSADEASERILPLENRPIPLNFDFAFLVALISLNSESCFLVGDVTTDINRCFRIVALIDKI